MSPHRPDLEHHLEKDDYFITLATSLDLLRQMTEQDAKWLGEIQERQAQRIDTLLVLRDELLHLQEHYQITKR